MGRSAEFVHGEDSRAEDHEDNSGGAVKRFRLRAVCEHGGDPSSIEFCHEIGLNYVSCSPYRVPIARLAAAQANIRSPRATK